MGLGKFSSHEKKIPPNFVVVLFSHLKHVRLFCNPMDCVAYQATLSMRFSRQEEWSGLPFPAPEGSSRLRDRTLTSCIGRQVLYPWATYSSSPGGSVVKNCMSMQETQETEVRSLGWEDPLEQEMATHCSIPAWKVPWAEQPGGQWSVGLPKARARTHTHPSFMVERKGAQLLVSDDGQNSFGKSLQKEGKLVVWQDIVNREML